MRQIPEKKLDGHSTITKDQNWKSIIPHDFHFPLYSLKYHVALIQYPEMLPIDIIGYNG